MGISTQSNNGVTIPDGYRVRKVVFRDGNVVEYFPQRFVNEEANWQDIDLKYSSYPLSGLVPEASKSLKEAVDRCLKDKRNRTVPNRVIEFIYV